MEIESLLLVDSDQDFFKGCRDMVNFMIGLPISERMRLEMKLKFGKQRLVFEKVLQRLVNVLYARFPNIRSHPDDEKVFLSLSMLRWNLMFGNIFISSIHELMKEHMVEYRSQFDVSCLSDIEKWMINSIVPFSKCLFGVLYEEKGIFEELQRLMLISFCNLRNEELFDIVADFPSSINAIMDFKIAAESAKFHGEVGRTLREAICRRLLQMGASTSLILDFFISMIKAMRLFDPSDNVLSFAAQPVREYLISRKDTVRCIVSSLTEGDELELRDELKKGSLLEYGGDEDDEEAGPGKNWVPPARYPELSVSSLAKSRGLDSLALLVSIYGSTDIFVNEYRILLSEKLLSNLKFEIVPEMAVLELLRIRFGEESLHACEVMLHDIQDSKRVCSLVSQQLQAKYPQSPIVEYAIVSDNYWPSFPRDEFKYHQQALAVVEPFEEIYAQAKKPRKLHRIPQLGSVELDLEFQDGSIRSFKVPPLLANLILFISEAGQSSSDKLSSVMGIEEEEIRQKMKYWVSRKVVRESSGCKARGSLGSLSSVSEFPQDISDNQDGSHETSPNSRIYSVIEHQSENLGMDDEHGGWDDNELAANSMKPADADRSKEFYLMLENYIKGLFNSQGPMPIERIHSMLKVIASAASEFNFEMNLIEFRRYLQGLIDDDKVEFRNGAYLWKK